jgi:predicted RNA-binding Zn-ribbon protein involved in translation (DUF1610 family)
MMSDFISMQCPSCGGKLSVGSNAISLKCEHCGAEHMIRREAGNIILESYARCPVCNRNDKVEKVSAILRSQTQKSQGITYQQQTTAVRAGNAFIPVTRQVAVPTHSSQVSELAKHLFPPPQPNPVALNASQTFPDGTSHPALISAIVTGALGAISLLCSCITLISMLSSYTTTDTMVITILILGVITILPIAASILLFVLALPRENKKNIEKRAVAEEKRRELQARAGEQVQHWKLAMDRWNRLYYCGRDDCVFLPGMTTYAPVTEMTKYLYQP